MNRRIIAFAAAGALALLPLTAPPAAAGELTLACHASYEHQTIWAHATVDAQGNWQRKGARTTDPGDLMKSPHVVVTTRQSPEGRTIVDLAAWSDYRDGSGTLECNDQELI